MRLQDFGADKRLEEDGNWIQINDEGLWLLIARIGSPKYTNELQRLMKPHLKEMRLGQIPKNITDLQKKAMAKTVLLGWRGLKDVGGNALTFSQDMALECLVDNQDFFQLVSSLAEDRENFQEGVEVESLGNLSSDSNGSCETAK